MSRHLERILDAAGQSVDSAKPILEINPEHPMVTRLAAETDTSRQADWAHLIFDQALLSEGGRLEDAAAFVRRMNTLIVDLAEGAGPAPARRRPAKKTATKKTAKKKAATAGRKTAGASSPSAGDEAAGASSPSAGDEAASDSAERNPSRD